MADCLVCHRELDSGTTCHLCRSRLASRLREIPALYEQVEVEACLATPPPSERTSGTGSHPLPMGLDILAALLLRVPTGETFTHPFTGEPTAGYRDLLESLEGWCRVVIEERDFSWPNYPPETYRGRVKVASGFLLTHAEWLSDQRFVDEVAADVQATFRLLKSAAAPDRSHAPTQIPCPGSEVDGPCSGRFSRDLSTGALLCRACGKEWDTAAIPYLAQVLGDHAVKIGDVCDMGFSQVNVRNAIRDGLIPNHGSEGSPRVFFWEVLDGLNVQEQRRRARVSRLDIRVTAV